MAEIVPSVKNPRFEDLEGINRIVNESKDKIANSDHLLPLFESQKCEGGGNFTEA